MFCSNCGAKISDNAKFCNRCGAKQDLSEEQIAYNGNVNNGMSTKLVPAKCTNCGGQLTVDPSCQSAVCPYCNSTFIVDQAINNYNVQMNGNMNIGNATINIQGLNTENLIARAKSYEAKNQFETALDYFNQVLDIDINNLEAVHGTYRIQQKMQKYVYITGVHSTIIGDEQTIEVTKDKIKLIRCTGDVADEYVISQIHNERIKEAMLDCKIYFKYPGKWSEVCLRLGREKSKGREIFEFIQNAKRGIYPAFK